MRKLLKKYIPSSEELKKTGSLGKLAKHLQHPQLWSFEQQPTAKGVSLGLFVAFLPLPGQMMIAAFIAYIARANLPIAVGLTWISNPFTFVPLNLVIYAVGKQITGTRIPYHPLAEFSWHGAGMPEIYHHVLAWLLSMGKPFLVGVSTLAIVSAIVGYGLVYVGFELAKSWHKAQAKKIK